MKLWRIASAGPSWRPADLSGNGPALSPGRWNATGEHVVYAAPTLAMAVLETSAHVDDHGLPLNRYVVEIDVPDAIWTARRVVALSDLEPGWDAIPHGVVSIETGSAWYRGRATALVELPSAIVPEESIVLINAEHPDAAQITAVAGRRFEYNRLFRPRGS